MAKMPAAYSSSGPDRDTKFLLEELFDVKRYAGVLRNYDQLIGDEGMLSMLMGVANGLSEEILAFHNSDAAKPKFTDGKVTLPEEMKALYAKYKEAGFSGATAEEAHGGAALPEVVNTVLSGIFNSADIPWMMLPILSQGAYAALRDHASPEVQAMFMPGLASGDIAGAMDMTEPGAGTGLGSTRARAEKDGEKYKLTGEKIFITFGDHDAAENIVHLVLARLPKAPEGVKGLTLFAVPKMIDGEPNHGVNVVGIEGHKLGLHHSPTCSMSYDGATAYLIGKENGGIQAMFTMMNEARLHVGVQAIGGVETAYQNTLEYVKTREVDGKPLLEKDDVRRKLLAMRSMVEGGRALATFVSIQLDIAHHHPDDAEKKKAQALVDMLTPVVKGYFTDKGVRAVREGLELHGGYGYMDEYPIARLDRDLAVTTIYEGANAVQATAILRSLKNIRSLTDEIRGFASDFEGTGGTDKTDNITLIYPLAKGADMIDSQVKWLEANKGDRDAAATDFMHLLGTVVTGYMLAKSAIIAEKKLAELPADHPEAKFYVGKIDTANYFVARELQRYTNPEAALRAGRETVRMRDQLPEKEVTPGVVATGADGKAAAVETQRSVGA